MNRLAWIVTVPIAIAIVLFAVVNRADVALSLWPLPWEIQAPLFLFTLGAIVFGFFFGALVTWISGGRTRQRLRHAQRELAEAQALLKQAQAQHGPAASPGGKAAAAQPNRMLPPAA